MKSRFVIAILGFIVILGVGTTHAAAGAKALAEPHFEGAGFYENAYGDDELIALMSQLLDDKDPLVREQTLASLGKTNNSAARQYLDQSLKDEMLAVRLAALGAIVELDGPESAQAVLASIDSPEAPMVLASLAHVRKLQIASATQKVRALLSASNDTLIKAAALDTLSILSVSADSSQLTALLIAPSPRLRLAAAGNAVFAPKDTALTQALRKAAAPTNPPIIRSAAIEALGKRAPQGAAELINSATNDSNPFIRRGATRACLYTKNSKAIVALLEDPSPMVRLAAIEAAGTLRIAQAGDRLTELMAESTDMPTHLAARQALRLIGTDAVAKAAGDLLTSLAKLTDLSATGGPEELAANIMQYVSLRNRNMASSCWLLGELKSKHAFAQQISLLDTLGFNSPILLEIAPALAKIGDPAAVKPLLNKFNKCQKQGLGYLKDISRLRPPRPYSEEVTGKIALALAALKGYDAVDTILVVIKTNVSGTRLPLAAAYGLQSLSELSQDDSREKIDTILLESLSSDDGLSLLAQFRAANSLGRLKTQAALGKLRMILTEERHGTKLMTACAWAIQEITGETPEIPSPRLHQGAWILTKTDE